MKTLIKFPIGVVGTSLGLCTLSSIYNNVGFSLIYYIAYLIALIVIVFFSLKIIFDFKVVKVHYLKSPITATLYSTYSMLIISISSFLAHFNLIIGQILWFTGIILHILLLLIFIYNFVYKANTKNYILPSWYVALLGVLVAVTVGDNIGFIKIQQILTIYGFILYFLTIPFIIKNLKNNLLPESYKYTKVILLASISLLIICYLKVIYPYFDYYPNLILLILFAILLLNYIYILTQLRSISMGNFMPLYAALTFPTAVTTIALYNLHLYLALNKYLRFDYFVYQLYGILIIIATATIIFVLYEFIKRYKTL